MSTTNGESLTYGQVNQTELISLCKMYVKRPTRFTQASLLVKVLYPHPTLNTIHNIRYHEINYQTSHKQARGHCQPNYIVKMAGIYAMCNFEVEGNVTL